MAPKATPLIVRHRIGGWLPRDQNVLRAWIAKQLEKCNHPSRQTKAFAPVIQDFQNLIEQDAEVWMAFHQMFEQVPTKPPYDKDPNGEDQVRDTSLIQGIQWLIALLDSRLYDHVKDVRLDYHHSARIPRY